MKAAAKKALTLVLAMVVIIALMVTCAVMQKGKSANDQGMTVTSLDELFDDDTLAKDGIEAMRSAGLIDENGKMVDLDVRENGNKVELATLATRIASGEDVGEITVNGNAVTTDKIMQLQQVNSSLDVIDLMDKDVEITDEHVANLKILLEDIATGKVNLSPIISEGAQQINVNRGAPEAPHFLESLVNSLSFIYAMELNKTREDAIADLTTLYEAGYIDAEGNPVELDPSLGADEINRINNGLEMIRSILNDSGILPEDLVAYENLVADVARVARVNRFVACYENLLGKSKKEAIAAWDTIYELGLLDSEDNIVKMDRWGDAAEIARVNQGLEGISLILADRSDEVTKEQVERLDNLLSGIAAGEIDLADVIAYYGAEAPTFSSIDMSEFSYSYSAYLEKDFDKATLDALYRIGYIDANGNPVKLDPALGSETINKINNGLAALRTILGGGTAFREETTAFDRFTTEVATTLDSLYADIHARVNALVACYETCLDKGKKDAKAALAVLKEVGLIDNSFNLTELSGDAAKIARVNQGLEVLRLLIDGRDDKIAKEHLVALDTLLYDIRVGYVDVYDIVPNVFDETGSVPEWIVTALAKAIKRNNQYIADEDERARMYLNKYYEVGLIDSDGQPATLAASGDRPKIYRVNQALEPIRMILQGRENEITDDQIDNINNLHWDIVNGKINVTDVIIPDWMAMPDNNGTGEVVATDGKFVAPYISGTEYEAEHSFELYDPDNTTWYTTADTKVSFYHATNPGAITAEDIGQCTAAEAKQWIINNWDDVMHVWEQTTFVFYNGSKLCDLYFFYPNEETDASVRSKSVYENYDVSYLPNCENLWVCTPSAGYVVGMGIERPANYNYSYSNDTYAGPKVYVHVKLNKVPAEGETVSVDFNMYSGGNTAGIKLNGASSAQPYSQTITWTSEDTELEKVFEIQAVSINVSSGRKRWGGEMGVVVNVNNPQNATLSGGVTSWTLTEVFVDYLDSELTTDIHTRITDVSVPAGRYYVGQVVPVTVTFHDYVKGTTGTKLTVNGVECALLGNSTIFDSLTFGYTVRGVDGGALDITDLTGVVDAAGNPVTLEDPIGARQFGLAQGVIIISDVKEGSFDWDNAMCGIDDVLGNQTVTIVIPFAPEGDKTWIINDAIEINPGITISVPGYENAKASYYLKSFYFSFDGGETRYPVFVLGDDDAEAFAVRLAVPYNDSVYLRKDTLHLYYDKDLNTTTNYLGAWEDRQTDANGFAYFTASGTAADLLAARSISYYVKGFYAYDKDATVKRANYNEANVSDGFYKQDYLYVFVPAEDYDRQHDVELLVNEALFNASKTGVRSEEFNAPLVLNYRLSKRATFTFADPKYFTWSTSDEQIATVKKDEATGQGQIVLNGGGGTVNIILTVGNGSAAKQYDIIFELAILEGKSPFMKIPEYSKERTTLTETDVDVLFSSNLTARNAATGVKETTFTAKLYKVDAVNDEPAGEPIWTANFASTQVDTLSHITVPGAKLANAGIYAVVVGASYLGGDVDGFTTEPEDFAVTAYIIVKQAPLKVTLKTLDSYSVNYGDLPTIEYTVSPSNANAVVEYTIQKSGEAVSARTSVTDGTIPFAATKPTGLKDAYTITVYAKSLDPMADDTWSMDSMLVRVYNTDILELIVADVIAGEIGGTTGGVGDNANDTTIDMDNHGKLPSYGITDGESYQLTFSDLNLLRTDMSLQKIISANYGAGVWGLVSDKMEWTSSDSDLVSINYKQGGTYSDIRYYSYTSYAPTSDFLLVGKDKTDGVTITAKHAATGMTASVTVTADTLENQLYVFQFYPKTVTSVTYTNGAGIKRELTSDDKGALAVYEPEGIDSAVMAISRQGDTTYVGTIFAVELQSGERDIASLQLYPCNNLRMRSISNAVLTFLNPDGSAYNGTVTLRAGVYKNGIYCPASKTFLSAEPETKYDATHDIEVAAINGKVTLGFDPTSFKIDPDSLEETGAAATDKITYVIEYRIGGYKTNYVMLTVSTDLMGEQKATDSVIRLISSQTSADVPQITRQTIRQYSDGTPLTYTKDVTDFTDYIGLSKLIDKVVLYTDYVLPTSVVSYDDNDIPSVSGEFALYTASGRKLTGQMERASDKADQIFDLADLDNSTLYVFPFSSSPIGRSIYTMTDEDLTADGISDEGDNAKPSSSIKAVFVKDGMTLTSVTLPFGICNLSHQEPTDGAEDAANEISSTLKSKISIAEIFNTISVNDMLKKGFLFVGGLATTSSDMPLKLMILPTEDPGVFHLIAFVGKRQKQSFGDGRLEIEYDVQKTKDDFKDLFEDNDTKVEASFSGTIILEAGYDFNTKEWKVGFVGGSVGMAFSASYEWTQNFMCGPVPATISFEVGAHAELEVSFASKASVRQMLVDATIGVSLDAFAGVGFDATIAKLKLGIYGSIGADVNFLMLSDFKHTPTTGTQLEIKGEIGIRLEVKVLFINYKETFASTGFNWKKKYNNYDAIQRQWAESGAAEVFGLTKSGRAYSMRLLSDGTALVAIESGGELEDRDYLDLGERAWNSGIAAQRGLRKGAVSSVLVDVQTNAYPYSNPVFVDDGSMFLYISDNDNADELQSVVSFATSNGTGYDMGAPLYDVNDENAVLADSDVVASGTGSNIFAAWVKQLESPEKEMLDKTTNDDLGMMMNATEIYVGAYDGSAWTTTRLTNNSVADMSPTIASRGEKAIVAWRSLSATKMPASGGEQDFSSMFDAENNIKYRMYDGATWSDATVAYNGSAGTVTAINSAMLANGTAIIAFTVRTGDDVTGTETYFTVINAAGDIVTTGRLTNDSYADTNTQVAAVGNQFVVGWYSEYDFGDVTAHDIRLARINADGSVDATFPESISVDTASDITTDFRFSAPADTDELSKLSIVWAQKQDSEDTKNTKYELSAMRFYEDGGAIGMTAPITIAETASNFTVDFYDTYTDESGKVHVIVLGSDYNSLDGLAEYDTIDLTNQPIETSEGSNLLTILDQNPLAYIKLGSGEFRDVAIEVTAATNIGELVPGLDLPVQFAIKNIGTSTVDKVNVQFGEVNKTVEGLALLPNQSTTITIVYPVPEGAVSDVEYTVTADDTAVVVETLVLNRPDVGISDMKLLSEENGERIVQVILYNASNIPFAGSGKTVKLGIYTSPDHEEEKRVGSLITITDADALASIDDGIYSVVQTLSVEALIGDADEIPASGIKLYAYAWVEDCEELYLQNNDESLSFKGLLTKSNGEIITVNTAIQVQTENETTVYAVRADIRNNSMQETSFGIPVALLLDDQGNIIAQKNMQDTSLTLTKEQTVSLSVTFTADELNGKTPATATVGAVYKVTFDVNGGSGTFDPVQTDFEGRISLPENEPEAPQVAADEEQLFFDGWYTDATNGTLITADYTFAADTTVYAHYVIHEHDFSYSAEGATITAVCGNTDGRHTGDTTATITVAAPALTVYGGEGSAEATVINNVDGVDDPIIVYKKGDIVLDAASTEAGTYTANITVGDVTASVTYTIGKKALYVTANAKAITYGDAPANDGVTYEGFIEGENESVLAGTLDYAYTYAQCGDVGTYSITPKGLTSDNYEIIFVPGVLTVGPKTITVTPDDKTSIYGNEITLTYVATGLVAEDTLTGVTLTRSEGNNVGTYVITATHDDAKDGNYIVTITGTATYTINKKAVTLNLYVDGVIVTEATSIIYDGQEHTFVVKAIGANDEVITIGAETQTDVFSSTEFIVYAQNLAADGSEYENYVLDNDYNVPDYAIAAKAITITADEKSSVYGESIVGLTAQITDGNGVYVLPDEDSEVFVLTKEQGVNAGEYVITVNVVGNSNYIVTPVNGIYTINQKAVTVTPDDKTITYGDDDLALTYAITGLVVEETLTGITLTRAEGNNAGTYAITATHDDTLDLNYAVTITGTGAYTIQKKANTINTDGIVKEYTYSGSYVTVDGATALGDGVISYENNVVKEAGKHTVVVKVTEGTNYLAAETTIDVFVKETAPVLNDESGTNTHGKIISVENALQGTSMTEIFKNAKDDESESKEISATIDTANIVFNEAAIEEISTAGEVELKFSVVYVDASEPIETDALKDAEVIIKVSLSEGITFANGKATITFDLKKELPDKKICKVYYVDADGNRTDMNATFADGKVTFETNHFSDYIVVFEKKGLSGGAIAGIVIGCFFGLLILAFVILFLLYSRDKNKDDDKKLIKVPFINNMMSKVDAFVSNIGKKKDVPAKAQDKTSENETADANETTGVVASQDTCVDAAEEEENGGVVVDAKGNYFNIRYDKSFTAKLIQSSDETKGYYGELKNEVLSYNKTKSRVSWSYDSINSGRAPVVKFGIRGKTLCVYFPLNAEELDEKYKVETVEAAKYEAVPCMYRIKNERRLRYAKELIAKVCETLGLTKGDEQKEDYYLPYERTEELIAKGLIKELKTQATTTQIERAKQEGTIRIVESVSADEVNDLISNEVAASAIIVESSGAKATGKKGIINVDTLSANFETGETVTIERLKEKKLIPASIGQVKLLARGKLDKVLHVELQDYSIEAVKMVIATGGTVKKV